MAMMFPCMLLSQELQMVMIYFTRMQLTSGLNGPTINCNGAFMYTCAQIRADDGNDIFTLCTVILGLEMNGNHIFYLY